jgi:hypothetical protein
MSREEMSFRLKAEATETAEPTSTAEAAEKTLLAEIEEQLRQAMSVQPSSDFARKVRVRIDERRVDRDWWTSRWAAAAACILAVVIGWRMVSQTDQQGPSRIGGERKAVDVRLAAPPTPSVRERPISIPKPVTRTSRQPAPSPPEVIVREDNARAVARLLALARSGSITEERLTPVAIAAASPTLDVPPLGVQALPVPEMEIQNGPPFGDGRRQ